MMLKRFAVLLVCSLGALADDETMQYKAKEEVTVWTNKVGPYHNPQETYDYYSLPFCKPNVSSRTLTPVPYFFCRFHSQTSPAITDEEN